MGQVEEWKINPLPSKTWHWLHMNDTDVKWNVDVTPCEIEEMEQAGALTTKSNLEKMQKNMEEWKEIETGAGKATDSIFTADNIRRAYLEAETGEDSRTLHVRIAADREDAAGVLCIRAQAGTEITVIETFSKGADRDKQLAFRTLVDAKANSKVRLVQVFLQDQTLLNDVGCRCAEGAEFEVLQLFIGKGNLYDGMQTDLIGKRSHTTKTIGYLGQNRQVIDMNLVVNHYGKKTQSDIQVDGILKDAAGKIFRGSIDFKKGSAESVGAETENVFLLGDEVVNKTIPLILCAEEDVQGSHGATIGELDEDTLFYFASRGMDADAAEDMMTKGKLEVLYRQIQDAVTEQLVEEQLAEVMEYDRA